ncbi:Epoxyqueuosine reductase QueH [bioreactor metagenome]|uniref:Epoxyqueuosine reductase QueH n=1 Tax=bioreactor metagenome TaxID=1076179 RepID=A0A644ZFP3_9ZZZZ|nr:epoxyqueuosine reductase QueH [Bacteroidaceae bacterium]MEA4971952.1 epoxyqueuosine reductase QueH [Candidatus Metalachnospira sp.]
MNKINYQKELDKIIEQNTDRKPSLLLHSCCAPCSSYVLEYLTQYFDITVFYFNPNISPENEYIKRIEEVRRLIKEMPCCKDVKFIEGRYDKDEFFNCVKGLESEREGGTRCIKCFELRLEETARLAKEMDFDYFCTTLSISPLKNADNLNTVGEKMAEKYGVKWLPSDFKKKNGFKRSIELSELYSLFRQDYCGCVFSKNE